MKAKGRKQYFLLPTQGCVATSPGDRAGDHKIEEMSCRQNSVILIINVICTVILERHWRSLWLKACLNDNSSPVQWFSVARSSGEFSNAEWRTVHLKASPFHYVMAIKNGSTPSSHHIFYTALPDMQTMQASFTSLQSPWHVSHMCRPERRDPVLPACISLFSSMKMIKRVGRRPQLLPEGTNDGIITWTVSTMPTVAASSLLPQNKQLKWPGGGMNRISSW